MKTKKTCPNCGKIMVLRDDEYPKKNEHWFCTGCPLALRKSVEDMEEKK